MLECEGILEQLEVHRGPDPGVTDDLGGAQRVGLIRGEADAIGKDQESLGASGAFEGSSSSLPSPVICSSACFAISSASLSKVS